MAVSAQTGYRHIETAYSDTLQRIAERELGDAARWVDIAALNGLLPPYLTGNPAEVSDKVLLYGALLLVPAPRPTVLASLDPALVFERDLSLRAGQLTASGGDFELFDGVPNLKQALIHAVSTEKGELLFHRDYGCDVARLKGELNGPVADLLAAAYVSSTLKADSRVKEVIAARAETVGDELRVDADIVPINDRQLNFQGVI